MRELQSLGTHTVPTKADGRPGTRGCRVGLQGLGKGLGKGLAQGIAGIFAEVLQEGRTPVIGCNVRA
jgi:hypothetical protein